MLTVLNKIGYQPSVNQLFPATVKPPASEVNGNVKIPAEQQFRSGIASMKVRSVLGSDVSENNLWQSRGVVQLNKWTVPAPVDDPVL